MSSPQTELLSFPQASEYLHLTPKVFENYAQKGREIPIQRIGRMRKVNKVHLDDWQKYFDETTVNLSEDNYFESLCFALEKFYSGAPRANFATSMQREAGKYLSDHISGYLGELAFQLFLKNKFKIEIRLDNNVDGLVRSQDIVSVSRRRGVENQSSFKVSVKTSKIKNIWLIVGKNEIELPDRKSDYYIFVRVDLCSDHIVRLIREHPAVEKIKEIIPPLDEYIQAQVCGFIEVAKLEGPTKQVDAQEISLSYVKRSGELRKDWQFLADNL